ncbi:hypothetical protein YPPY56_0544, partial [Yersinia pestis PY-56]
MERINL